MAWASSPFGRKHGCHRAHRGPGTWPGYWDSATSTFVTDDHTPEPPRSSGRRHAVAGVDSIGGSTRQPRTAWSPSTRSTPVWSVRGRTVWPGPTPTPTGAGSSSRPRTCSGGWTSRPPTSTVRSRSSSRGRSSAAACSRCRPTRRCWSAVVAAGRAGHRHGPGAARAAVGLPVPAPGHDLRRVRDRPVEPSGGRPPPYRRGPLEAGDAHAAPTPRGRARAAHR